MVEEGRRPLRVGLLLDGERVSAWQRLAIERVRALACAELVLVVMNATPGRGGQVPLAYRLYRVLDRRLFRAKPDAFATVEIGDLLTGVPRLRVLPSLSRHCDRFSAEDLTQIRSHAPDVLIRFGFRILRGEVLRAAPLGVWSWHHGDPDRYRGGPPGFWEVMDQAPATGAILQRLSDDLDNGLVLCRTWSLTDKLSVNRNKNRLFWTAAPFAACCLMQAHREGPDAWMARLEQAQPPFALYGYPLYSPQSLGWGAMAALLGPLFWRNLWRKLKEGLWREQWFLLYRFQAGLDLSFWRFQRLIPPPDRFWADPHVLRKDGLYWLFYEEYEYRTKRGRICCRAFDAQGQPQDPVVALERPYHLSYPQVFEYQGEIYLVPETWQNRQVELYRASEFPTRWELVRVLLVDIVAVDATLVFHEGRWWLFANVQETPGGSTFNELFLYSTDDLLGGEWEAHPANPIVSDVRRARPAGGLFAIDGVLYRPAQNCAGRYGSGIVINRIDRLTPDEYAETPVQSADASFAPRIGSLHTLNYANGLVVADARMQRLR